MQYRRSAIRAALWLIITLSLQFSSTSWAASPERIKTAEKRLLYVAAPGIRDYLEYGGHGVLVFDIDQGHRFVKRLALAGVDEKGKPLNVKGIVANATTRRLYVTTTRTLTCLDLVTEKILWEKAYDGGCDRLALAPDGKHIYLPSLEKAHWHIVDALSGDVLKRLEPGWITFSLDGRYAYPSTGDVIETARRKIIAGLKDDKGTEVQSEKLLEIDFANGQPVRAGDQFGLGRKLIR